MRYSKARMMKWLEKNLEILRSMTDYFESKDNEEMEIRYRTEAMAIQSIIWMMTDDKFFEKQYEIYFKEDEE